MLEDTNDSDILDFLHEADTRDRHLQNAAWDELQRYRAEAMQAAKIGEDRVERELRVALARGRLKERLRELLTK